MSTLADPVAVPPQIEVEESPSLPPVEMPRRARIRASISVSVLLFAGGITEVLKNAALAYRYGSSRATDAFFAAFLIPNTYAMFWVSAAIVGLVPLFARWDEEQGAGARRQISNALRLSVLSMAALSVLIYAAAPLLSSALVPGFTPAERQETTRLLRQLTPLFVLVGFTGVASAVLNSRHLFLLSSANKLFVNAVLIGGLLLLGWTRSIGLLCALLLIGAAAFAIALGARLWPMKLDLFSGVGLHRGEVMVLLSAMFLPFVALMARQTSALVEREIASFLQEGSVTVITYGYQVVMGVTTIVAAGVSTVLMPLFARQRSQHGAMRLIADGLYYLCVTLLPLACFVYLIPDFIVTLIFRHGVFSAAAATDLSRVIRAYAPGLVLSSIGNHFQTPFWAQRRYRLLIVHNTLMAAVNIVLDLALAPFFGVVALALGFSGAALVHAMRLGYLLRRDFREAWDIRTFSAAMKPAVATLVMGAAIVAARHLAPGRAVLSGALTSDCILLGCAVAAYVVAGAACRMEPFPTLWQAMRAWNGLRTS